MRINQFLSHNTKLSRREADNIIQSGRVKIGHKIADLSDKVGDLDRVFVDSREIKRQSQYTIIVYNKPKGELVSRRDDRGRRVIFDSLEAKFAHFTPVGRLDFASLGLLILSDSVKIATALTKSNLTRIYNVKVEGKITDFTLSKILDAAKNGLSVANARAGGHKNSKITAMDFAPFAFFEIMREGRGYTKIKVGINEGQNRELRRFFAYFGLNVVDLVRVSFGFIHLNALPSGKSRYLDKREYKKVREFLRESSEKNSAHFCDSKNDNNQSARSAHLNALSGKGEGVVRDGRGERLRNSSPLPPQEKRALNNRGFGADLSAKRHSFKNPKKTNCGGKNAKDIS